MFHTMKSNSRAYLHDPIWPRASRADSNSSVSGVSDELSILSMADTTVFTPAKSSNC